MKKDIRLKKENVTPMENENRKLREEKEEDVYLSKEREELRKDDSLETGEEGFLRGYESSYEEG